MHADQDKLKPLDEIMRDGCFVFILQGSEP